MTARVCAVCKGSLASVHPNRSTCGEECKKEHLRRAAARHRQRVRSREKTPPAEKRCGKCRQGLPANAFGPNPSQSCGLQNYCRACRRALSQRPDQKEKERERQRLAYLLRGEERRHRFRMRFLLDRDFRDRVLSANRARYHTDPRAHYERSRLRYYQRKQWEAENARRCFCGRALPAEGNEETGKWFCRVACKVRCSRFVVGLEGRG